MAFSQRTHDVILSLKQIKSEKDLTLQEICDQIIAKGGYVSMTTLRRVFADGSENQSFRYSDSIKPIADLLLEISAPLSITPDTTVQEAELEALRSIVRMKNEMIEELQDELDESKQNLLDFKAEAQWKIDLLKEEVNELRLQTKRDSQLLDERRDFIYSKDKAILGRNIWIIVLATMLSICFALVIAALIADKFNAGVGFFLR